MGKPDIVLAIGAVAAVVLIGPAAGLLVGCAPAGPGQGIPFDISDAPASRPRPAGAAPPVALPPLPGESASAAPTDMLGLAAGAISRAKPMVPAFDANKRLIHLAGSRNEVVSFQVSFAGPPRGLSGLRLSMSDLELSGPRQFGVRVPRLDRHSVELFRVLPIRVFRLPAWYQVYETGAANRARGDFPDALVPADHFRLGQPWNVAAGEKLSVWADLPIPTDAKPGTYEGRLTVTTGNFPAREIVVRLEVLPFTLPAEPSLHLLCPINLKQMLACELDQEELSDSYLYGSGEPVARKRLTQWIDLGRRHGVQFLVADVAPIYKRDLNGKVGVDWAGYDRLMGVHLSGAGAPPVWLAPFRLDYPEAGLYGGLNAVAYTDVAESYLRAIGQHFAANGWPRPLVWIHRDWPVRTALPYGADHWRDWLTERRRRESLAIGRLVLMTELNMGYLETLPWTARPAPAEPPPAAGAAAHPSDARPGPGDSPIPPYVSAYCPAAQFLDPAAARGRKKGDSIAWLGEGVPPWRPSTQLFARAEQLEALAYLATRYRLDAVWLGPTQRWPTRSPLAAPLEAGEAGFLFYPGHWFDQDRPVASLRLKFLRQAAQNAAYLRLLAEAGKSALASRVTDAVVKYALAEAACEVPGVGGPIGWIQAPAFYADARMMLRQELDLASRGPARLDTVQLDRSRFNWLQFHERTAWIRLGLYPGQLVDQLDSFGAPSGTMRAVFRMDAHIDRTAVNPTVPDEPVGRADWPTLLFGPLPKTWRATRFNVPVQAGARGPSRPVALAADGRELQPDGSARVAMPAVLRSETGLELETLATSVPVLPAHPFRRPPRIDGLLDDWPVASWFRGGSFHRLSSPRPLSLFGQPTPAPTETWFMAGYDDRNLYLSVTCLDQVPAQVTPRYANNVLFDRGLIVGEDAVEVILDPTGGRLGAERLFRLVVKSTGMALGWRGMTGPGGTGPPEPWGRDIRVEVRFRPQYWVVELAIPKAELAPVNEQGLWRLNVARHLAARGEHSSWASARPVLGDPRTLGNLLLRKPPLPKLEVPLLPPSPLDDIRMLP